MRQIDVPPCYPCMVTHLAIFFKASPEVAMLYLGSVLKPIATSPSCLSSLLAQSLSPKDIAGSVTSLMKVSCRLYSHVDGFINQPQSQHVGPSIVALDHCEQLLAMQVPMQCLWGVGRRDSRLQFYSNL